MQNHRAAVEQNIERVHHAYDGSASAVLGCYLRASGTTRRYEASIRNAVGITLRVRSDVAKSNERVETMILAGPLRGQRQDFV